MYNGNFTIEYYDEDEAQRIQYHYSVSEKGYCYSQVAKEDGTTYPKKRISEKQYISAIEEYYNA